MVEMMLGSWGLPLTIVIVGVIFIFLRNVKEQVQYTAEVSANKSIELCQNQLLNLVEDSRTASYQRTIEQAYQQYESSQDSEQLYQQVTSYLNTQHKYNYKLLSTMVYFVDKPQKAYFTHRKSEGSTYESSIEHLLYQNNAIIKACIKDAGTKVVFLEVGGHFYVVRNIVDNTFEPYAVIVMDVDTDKIFGNLESVWGCQEYDVRINGNSVFGESMSLECNNERATYREDGTQDYVCCKQKVEGQTIDYIIKMDSTIIYQDRRVLGYVIFIGLLFVLPLIGIMSWFLYHNITAPVQKLVDGVSRIKDGGYGVQVERADTSQEMKYLGDSINDMSTELKHQFETIYVEELALKDAKIMSLQSQMNPHFLNNTLEIINWEARLNGDLKVSKMIEALSTMLEYALNRKEERTLTLREEMSYVEAYLYIIKERFENKIHVEKHIEEQLLDQVIPRCIIQPIVENAVEHGMSRFDVGEIALHIYKRENNMVIEVRDNGHLTIKNRDHISQILNDELDGNGQKSQSLGIHNVHKRIQIIYGEHYGLKIHPDIEGNTISEITLPLQTKQED